MTGFLRDGSILSPRSPQFPIQKPYKLSPLSLPVTRKAMKNVSVLFPIFM